MAVKVVRIGERFYIVPAEDREASADFTNAEHDTSALDAFIRGQGALVEGGLDDLSEVEYDEEKEDSRTL